MLQPFFSGSSRVVVNKVLDTIMEKRLSRNNDRVSMTILLEWKHWPLFFSFFRKLLINK